MFLRQIQDPNLAQYSYLIGCQRSGEAIVIDPERDIERYQEIASQEGLKITAVAETHIHADFVSGARQFTKSDPDIHIYVSAEGGPQWQSEWAIGFPNLHLLRDGDSFKIGNIELQVIHTPGHTPEHMVYLVTDHGGGANEPIAMLSGDFLFVGDAGRPDLLEQAAGLEGTQEIGAQSLYKSLRKVAELPCHVQILPAHGAGSSCGKALGSVPVSTFGYEEKFNPALKLALSASEEDFVNFILSGQPEPPAYFANMKHVNKIGPAILEALPTPPAMTLANIVNESSRSDFVILDTRDRDSFRESHFVGSLFAPKEKFSDFAGSYLSPNQKIALVVEEQTQVNDFVRQLIRIGFNHIVGFIPATLLPEAPETMKTATRTVKFSEAEALTASNGHRQALDVRKATEFALAHLRDTKNIAHTRLLPRIAEIDAKTPLLVSCGTGMRATGASAFLARKGMDVICVNDKFENAPQSLLAR
jgi:hydroxyacylglutathione hydrolase